MTARRLSTIPVAFLALACLAAAGCGNNGLGRYPVKGTVTFRGQPLEQGNIQFLRVGGQGGGGSMIREGRYEVPQVHGLEPGTYKVLINSPVEVKTLPPGWQGGSRPTEERIPPEYSSFEKTTATVEVKPTGANLFDFTIP